MQQIIKIGSIWLLIAMLLSACGASASEPGAAERASDGSATREMLVYRSPTCGCCSDWVAYLEEHGYSVTVEDVQDMTPIKDEHRVPATTRSCHTALIDGYVVEGHVPVEDIERLLAERPDVVGIAVPGMPVGSPGMEVEGAEPQPYNVVSFDASGATEVYSSYHQ